MSNKFTEKAEKSLNRIVTLAEELGHTYIGSEHLLLSLLEEETSCASVLLYKNKVTKEKTLEIVKDYSGLGEKSRLSSKDTTPRCRKIIENSYKISKKYSAEKIGTSHILLALLEERECVAIKILLRLGIDVALLKEDIVSFLRTSEKAVLFAEPITESSIPNLTKYGKNLTKLAEGGNIDPVIGREKETERLIRILTRKTKNNPCLIGEAGVGKTAIVEGLAIRIATGDVPGALLGKSIITLDLTSMVAGAKYRGDFEERIKNIMSEAAKNKSIILFIDEIHTIVGAGSAEGAIDASNIMKPELSRGDIQLIGATTLSEYKKYIEKDGALERRFQPVMVEESTIQGTLDILFGIRERYEAHHGVKIEDDAIRAAVLLSERYIQDRFLPDKAIDVLDEACAMTNVTLKQNNKKIKNIYEKMRQLSRDKSEAVRTSDFDLAFNLKELEKICNDEIARELKNYEEAKSSVRVTEADIRRVISEITGIFPPEKSEAHKARSMKENIGREIIGQDDAIDVLVSAVSRNLAGINSPDKPRGIFLFLGESGVGKTELAMALARELFGTRDALIRYDMSEYSESYSVSKLIGTAPGYVGYEDSNSAFEKVRRHPYSVILFDEIEKAHGDVLSLFLQIFDSGFITDASGRKISFKNSYIIMTSNIGADKFLGNRSLGFLQSEMKSSLHEHLKSYFKEEFINRIDDIILFSALSDSALSDIARRKISELSERIISAGITLLVDDAVYGYFAKKGRMRGFGARPMNRLILFEIENKLAEMIVAGDVAEGDRVLVSVKDDSLSIERHSMELVGNSEG